MKDVSKCDLSNNIVLKKERCVRKRLRDIIVNFVIDICRLTELSDVTIGYIIKIAHFLAPWNILLMAIILPLKIAPIVLMPFFVASGLFILLKGCFLTIVEFKLCKNDFNIVDPYIRLFGQKPTENIRYIFTICGMCTNFLILIFILYLRGYFQCKLRV
jgi:hypothetical protein|tara:strand:- start:6307 stop:6783 length:477 start_codon:yes stop_codon:yes gene_type:complete